MNSMWFSMVMASGLAVTLIFVAALGCSPTLTPDQNVLTFIGKSAGIFGCQGCNSGEGEAEDEGDTHDESEGESPAEGEAEDEGEMHDEGEGESPAEGEAEDEGEMHDEGEGVSPAEGEGEREPDFYAPCSEGGDGTIKNPYIICSIEDLQDIGNDVVSLRAHYRLGRDIDASSTTSWNMGAGFVPIGTRGLPFEGSLDGNNFTIHGLHINTAGVRDVGLFGAIGTEGRTTIKNIGIVDCSITATVTAKSDIVSVGTLVGSNAGNIQHCFSTGNVMVYSDISDQRIYVGGLLGYSGLTRIDGSYSKAAVKGDVALRGDIVLGGLLGAGGGSILENCHATGNVTANGSAIEIGGLVGRIQENWQAGKCIMKNCYASGNVEANTTNWNISAGGLIGVTGYDDITVENCFASGDVIAKISSQYYELYAGGLIGCGGYVFYCHASGSVTAEMFGELDTSASFGVGGLLGKNTRAVEYSYANGSVTASCDIAGSVGGLVGIDWESIKFCYASGAVTAQMTNDANVGGLVGSGNTITDCYSTGTVAGTGNVGGLVGSIKTSYPWVVNCYSAGYVTGTGTLGGLLADDYSNEERVKTSFWNVEISGQDTSAGGSDIAGLTSFQMMQRSPFINAGWDFSEVWNIAEGTTYPWLRNLDYSDTGFPAP